MMPYVSCACCQAKIAVSLRHQLQKANVENNALAHKLAEAEAQVRPHELLQHAQLGGRC